MGEEGEGVGEGMVKRGRGSIVLQGYVKLAEDHGSPILLGSREGLLPIIRDLIS